MLTTLAEHALPDRPATERLAATLAGIARRGDVFALEGDLGAGKTVFARAFIRARGCVDEDVPSPTFTLVQVYEPPLPDPCPIYHFDLYRLDAPEEAWELDIEDAFEGAICLIEWPDRLGALLPACALTVRLLPGTGAEQRRLLLAGAVPWRQRLQEVGLV